MVFTSIEFRLRVVCVIAPELLSVLAETLEATSPFHVPLPSSCVPARDQSRVSRKAPEMLQWGLKRTSWQRTPASHHP